MIDVPVTPEMIKWAVSTGLTVPLLLYVTYHIKWGKIAAIQGNMGSIIKVLIAVAETNDEIKEDEVVEEFQPDERAVADYKAVASDGKQNGGGASLKKQD